MKLQLQPITQKEANRFLADNHRHHKPPTGYKFAIAVNDGTSVVGVVTVGRPVARALDNTWTAEVTRCCTDWTPPCREQALRRGVAGSTGDGVSTANHLHPRIRDGHESTRRRIPGDRPDERRELELSESATGRFSADVPKNALGGRMTRAYHPPAQSQEWETPRDLFDRLDHQYAFELDPVCTEKNRKCPRYYTAEVDGLTQPWYPLRSFVNPPYGRDVGQWVAKGYNEALKGTLVVLLLPAYTDTQWFHDYCLPYGQIEFLRGRLKFIGAASSAPFRSMLVTFPKDADRDYERLMRDRGIR